MATEMNVEAERARRERENADFTEWWNSSGQGADPAHTLITENACHATWQERARRAAQPADVGAGQVPKLEFSIDTTEFLDMVCEWRDGITDGACWSDIIDYINEFTIDAIAADRRAREEAGNALNGVLPTEHGADLNLAAPPLSSKQQAEKGEGA